jgi:hypothetical protein
MSHYIAIITSREYYSGDYDGYNNKVIESITDWEEVTDDEFKTLQFAGPRLGFTLLERPADIKTFVAKTIKDYKAIAKAEADRAAEEKRKREEAALQRKYKKELKDKASKEKMLTKLAQELGVDLSGLPKATLPN